jgi:hypothetical protein
MSKSRGSNKILIGVLIAIVLAVLLCCCGGGVGTLVYGVSKSEPVVIPAMRAAESPRVKELLGDSLEKEPTEFRGNIELGDNGVADYEMGIVGTKGKGTLVVKAHKKGDKWVYEVAEVRTQAGETIDLLPIN